MRGIYLQDGKYLSSSKLTVEPVDSFCSTVDAPCAIFHKCGPCTLRAGTANQVIAFRNCLSLIMDSLMECRASWHSDRYRSKAGLSSVDDTPCSSLLKLDMVNRGTSRS